MAVIKKNEGYNDSENILASLCEKTFLKLWSYPSLFRDDGKERNGVGKELCDLLIVFGNEIIIFSDKMTFFQIDNEEVIAWQRWNRKAINDSGKQLIGAKKWIKKFPERVFLDHACSERFPFFEGKNIDGYNIHLIAIANGLPVEKRLVINTSKNKKSVFETEPVHSNEFIHVFDTLSFKNITNEIDTAKDFIDYLNQRKEIISNVSDVYCCGEENLLAEYLLRVDLPSNVFKDNKGKVISSDEYENLINARDYNNGKKLDKDSYLWDFVINNIATHLMDGTLITYNSNSLDEKKMLIEKMAGYDRLSRRQLSKLIINKYSLTPPLAMSSFSVQGDNHFFTLIIAPFLPYKNSGLYTYEQYIEIRLSILQAYCVALYEEHDCDIIGIITDNVEMSVDSFNKSMVEMIFSKGVSTLYRLNGEVTQWEKDNLDFIRKTFNILNPKRIVKTETIAKQYPNDI